MRITGGEWTSRRLLGPRGGSDVRPTPDALREQAFAILGPHLAGARFLDLFAGTGAITLEALSRGAAHVAAVERDRRSLELVRHNLEAFAVSEERCEVLPLAASAAVARLAQRRLRFAAGWCDPPFASWDDGVRDLEQAAALGLFLPAALVVLELPPRRDAVVAGFTALRPLRGAALLQSTPP